MNTLLPILLGTHLFLVSIGSTLPLIYAARALFFRTATPLETESGFCRGLLISILSLLAGTLIGLLYGWLVWDSELSSSISKGWSRIFFGIMEFFFSLLLLVISYWMTRKRLVKSSNDDLGRLASWLRTTLLVIASTNLLYHFPLLFIALRQVNLVVEQGELASSQQFRSLFFHPKTLILWIHFLSNSLYVTVVVASAFAEKPSAMGCRTQWSLALLFICQLVSGVCALAYLPRAALFEMFQLQSPWLWFLVQVVALGAIQFWMLCIALGRRSQALLKWVIGWCLCIYILMSAFSANLGG